jgi:glycosyltransferase involved in cell wall biosynthesis
MNKKINVLMISPLPPPSGGIASWTEQAVNWFKSSNIEINIINSNTLTKHKSKIISSFLKLTKSLGIVAHLIVSLTFKNIDIIHINTSLEDKGIIRDLLTVLLSTLYRKKVILHYRCNIQDQVNFKKYKVSILKIISKLTDQNICLNNQSIIYMSDLNVECFYLPNFIVKPIKTINKEYTLKITKILFVGHVTVRKGITEIIRAAKSLGDIQFDIVGPYDKKIKLKSPMNMKFHGEISRKNIDLFYEQADILLLPTHSEGFSNVILEAMSFGLPIITTDVGANRKILEDRGALYCKVYSYEDIIENINALSKSADRMKLGEWNRSKAEHYYEDVILNQLKVLYDNLCQSGK